MRLSLSLAALGLLQQQAACTSAAASANTVVGKKASLRRTAAAARATHKRRLIETDADFDEDTELRQDDLDEEFEPEAPLNPTNVTQPIEAEPMNPIEPVPENLPEPDEPMPENPIELPDNCKDCLGKDSAGAFAFVAEDATGTGKCVVSCDSIPLEVGETCYSGAENDDKVCKDLEKAAQEAAKLAEEEAKLAEEEAAAAAEEEAAAAEEDAAPPLPSDLTTCEACLGPDAQGQIYAWFPKLGDAGTCLSGCGVNNDSPCFTGAIYTDENCDGIAEAMAKLDEATAAPTDAADEEEEDMMPTAAPTMVEVEATMAPTKEGGATTTGTPTMIIPPEGEGMMEPTSEPSMPIAAVPTSMPIAAVPTFVTPEPTAGGDEVDVEDAIVCPEGYTSDTFFTQADGDLCNICTGPPVTTLPEVEGNSTEPVEPIVEECTVTCGSDACDFAPVGCGVVICPGDLTADPTATPTVMTTMAPTTATPTMMPTATVTSTTVAPTMMTEPTAAPTATDAPTPEVASGTTGRAVATGIVGAVATATAYLLMA